MHQFTFFLALFHLIGKMMVVNCFTHSNCPNLPFTHMKNAVCSVRGTDRQLLQNSNLKIWNRRNYNSILYSSNEADDSIELAHLTALCETGESLESEGQRMAESIAAWLDKEWMPQEVHLRVGLCAKDALLEILESKGPEVAEVSDVMMAISDSLFEKWDAPNHKFGDTMFVNAWDVGNYASDYLFQRMKIGSCKCSTTIVEPEVDKK